MDVYENEQSYFFRDCSDQVIALFLAKLGCMAVFRVVSVAAASGESRADSKIPVRQVLSDVTLARLLTFHNVQITAHQAFLTNEALETIASTTIMNLQDFMTGKSNENEVKPFGKK
jgi:lactate dehydrogenase-like 2-hydroxyacid dehydrogenase